jgi:hypothetical protein
MKITDFTPARISFSLELTALEAKALMTVVGHVLGDHRGPRGACSEIFDFLASKGIEPSDTLPDNLRLPARWGDL